MKPSPDQQDMFGGPDAVESTSIVQPAAFADDLVRLAHRQPKNVHYGTSSWSFPGWARIVYAQAYDTNRLSRYGLGAFSSHPLFSTVCVDRGFHQPVPAADYKRYAESVPDDFRFIVKAYSGLTTFPDTARGQRLGDPVFLDADYARRVVIDPIVEGLGAKLGGILLQFSPLGPAFTRTPGAFADRLGGFLGQLPGGVPYAVEVRDPEVLGPAYEAALIDTGVSHCPSVHPRMPPVDAQGRGSRRGPFVVRWMLHPTMEYSIAAQRYGPFDRMVDPDPVNRRRVVNVVADGLAEQRQVHLIVGNNAEGSAPFTILEVARALAS